MPNAPVAAISPAKIVRADGAHSIDQSALVPASRLYFFRAMELTPDKPDGFGRQDVRRVESVWGLVNGDWISCGYVVALRSGRRMYLRYDLGEHLREDDSIELVEKVELLAMGAERYPQPPGLGIAWDDDVGHINEHLAL
jgi:hypothetical protein